MGDQGDSTRNVIRMMIIAASVQEVRVIAVSGAHLDLIRASYVLYGAQYIDPVSLSRFYLQAGDSHIDLIRASYVVYGVNYIDLVTPAPFFRPRIYRVTSTK